MVSKRFVVLGIFTLSIGAAVIGTLWNLQGENLQGQLAAGASQTVDDGDAGFQMSGKGWQSFQHALGYKGDISSPTSPDDPALGATWIFSNVSAGQYKFLVTFKAYSLLTNQAPYVIRDGSSVIGSVTMNQKVDPSGNLYDDKNWALLGTYTVKGPSVSITLTRPQGLTANGVIADAARIERVGGTTAAPTAAPNTSLTLRGAASSITKALPTTGTQNSAAVPTTAGTPVSPGTAQFAPSRIPGGDQPCPFGAQFCPPCQSGMTPQQCAEMRCAMNGKVLDQTGFRCVCPPGQGCADGSQDPFCTCGPLTCPPGYHIDDKTFACLPDSVCGDGYLEYANQPREYCELDGNQGCPPERTCSSCSTCLVCGDGRLTNNEECEADYLCASGKSCGPTCSCTDSATPLTANVTTTIASNSRLVTTTVISADITRVSWSIPVRSGEAYDVYVAVHRTCNYPSTSCPIPSCPTNFWKVFNGSQEVRPLLVGFGSPLCYTWPGSSDKLTTWVRLAQVQTSSSEIRVQHEPTPLPTNGNPNDPARRFAVADSVRLVKVVSPAPESPAPLGVTLIDDGDQGFSVGGTYETLDGSPVLPWYTTDQGQLSFGNDFVSPSYYPSWSFTVTPNSTYSVLVSYRAPNQPGSTYNRTYSITDGWNNALPPAPRGQELGPVTIDGKTPPDGAWFRGVQWKEIGTFTVNSSRLTITGKTGLFGSDAIRIIRQSGPVSSSSRQSSAVSSVSSAVACATEGEIISEMNMRPCCAGLVFSPNLVPNGSQCPDVSLTYICTRCGNGQCGTGENFCNCLADCPHPGSSSSSRSSSSSSSSSAASSQSSGASSSQGGLCGNGRLDPGEQCDPRLITFAPQCGGQPCDPVTCQCPGSSSSRSSSSSSCIPIDCAAPPPGCRYVNPIFQNGCMISCGTLQCGSSSSSSSSAITCGNNQLDTGEQCDGANYPCQAGQICTAACQCATLPPGSIQWQTVGDSYILSTITDYALFGHGSYLYVAGGMDFWGTTSNEMRSTNGLNWSSVAALPQPLSNAAPLQSDGIALLLGGLANRDSVVNWAFATPDLLTTGFRSNAAYALPVSRYDGAALRIGTRTYFLGGSYLATPLDGSLLGSLVGSLFGQAAVPYPSREIYVHNGTSWSRLQPDLPFHVTKNDAFTIGGKLFILDRSTPRKVFMSEDGTAWTQVATFPVATSDSTFLKPALHKGAIWLIGTSGSFAGSAMATVDGQQWQTVTGVFPSDLDDFTPDGVVSFQDELWMLGTVSDLYTGGNGRNGKVLKTGAGGGPVCGNGHIEGEACDDGNTANGDGCDQNCHIEQGWLCGGATGQQSVCARWLGCDAGYECNASPYFGNDNAWHCGFTGAIPPGCHVERNGEGCGNADWCGTAQCQKIVCDGSSSSRSSSSSSTSSVATCSETPWTACPSGYSCTAGCSGGNCRRADHVVCAPGTSPQYSNDTCGNNTCSGSCARCVGSSSSRSSSSSSCRVYQPPICLNGILVPQLSPDANGCRLPPVCCEGANNPTAQCTLDLQCGNGTCVISACTCQ